MQLIGVSTGMIFQADGMGVTEIPAAVTAELARLQAENARLLKMPELSPRQAAPPGPGSRAARPSAERANRAEFVWPLRIRTASR
jgi:hypothetical protein